MLELHDNCQSTVESWWVLGDIISLWEAVLILELSGMEVMALHQTL